MAEVLKCPTRDELVRLSNDELPSDRSESLFDHVESCERCSSMYSELAESSDAVANRFAGITPDDLERARDGIEADALRETGASLFPKLTGLIRARESQPALNPPCDLGEYKVIKRIGFGGMGEVYEAHDPLLERHLAIKVIRRFRQDDPEAVEHFRSEVMTAGQLNHPNLVAAYRAWSEQDGNLYLAQEFLEGESLQDLTIRGDFGGPKEIIDAMIGTCRGLEQLHTIDFVHRDIKPANVMRLHDGTIKVIDFGLAMAADSAKSAARVAAGTVGYMSPEQAHGTGPIDHRSDIYSAGRMLKYLLAKTQNLSTSKRQVRALEKLKALAEWMTRKSPRARPKNISLVISQLEKIQRPLLRSKIRPLLYAAAFLVVVALGVSVFLANNRDRGNGIAAQSAVQDEVTRQFEARRQLADDALAKEWNTEIAPRLERETAELRSNVKATLDAIRFEPPDQGVSNELGSLFSPLPNMVVATVPQPPTYDQGTDELAYTVRLAPNEAAYRASLPRLRQTLESLAVGDPEETTVRPTLLRPENSEDIPAVYSIPQIESDPRTAGTQGIVSLLIDWNSAQTYQVWMHYVVDFGAVEVQGTGWQFIKPKSQHWLQIVAAQANDEGRPMAFPLLSRRVETQFVDKFGGKVDLDAWEWFADNYVNWQLPQSFQRGGLPADRNFNGVPNLLVSPVYQHLPLPDEPVLVNGWTFGTPQNTTNNFRVTIAPLNMMQSTFADTTKALVFSPASTKTRRIRFDSKLSRGIATVKVSTRTTTAK